MVQNPLVECSFLIPIRRDANLSDGSEHEAHLWDWFEDELRGQFGGFTCTPGKHRGSYIDPDTQQSVFDESVKFIVAVTADRVTELRRLLSAACLLFQQKCIYLSVAGHVEFVGPAQNDKH